MSKSRVKTVDAVGLARLASQALTSPRLRKNLNLHETLEDPFQRFLNDFEPGTYVRPHRHLDKWELFALLQGAAAVLIFDDTGTVLERVELNIDSTRIVEIPANTWHTLVSFAPRTILFETKPGPYDPNVRGEFAAWAPPEGDAQAAAFVQRLAAAQIGDSVV